MKEKQRLLFELRIKEIESLDRDTTKEFFTLLAGTFLVLGFIYTKELLKDYGGSTTVIIFGVSSIIVFSYLELKLQSFIADTYEDLFIALKENKLENHKIKFLSGLQLSTYKRRYK